jgi:hypothetical protein
LDQQKSGNPDRAPHPPLSLEHLWTYPHTPIHGYVFLFWLPTYICLRSLFKSRRQNFSP